MTSVTIVFQIVRQLVTIAYEIKNTWGRENYRQLHGKLQWNPLFSQIFTHWISHYHAVHHLKCDSGINSEMVCVLCDIFRCVAGDEAFEKQKKRKRWKEKFDNAQAAMMELTQENQSLQVWLKQKWRSQLDKISRIAWLKFSSAWKQPVPGAEKRDQVFARGKVKYVSSAGNMQLVPCAGKHGTPVKRGKTCNRCFAREIALKLIRIDVDLTFNWLKNLDCLHSLVIVFARIFFFLHQF